jgi:hypothetical protein
MRNQELLKKADIALSDLASNGGVLPPQATNRFIRTLINSPTMLNVARVVTMNGPDMKINRSRFRFPYPAACAPSGRCQR